MIEGVLLDEKDSHFLKEHNWYSLNGYAATQIKKRTVYLHRLIMNAPKGMEVDHINRNKLDNRRSNLRIVSRAFNNQNRSVRSESSTGIRGVFYCANEKRQNKYRARVWLNGKGVSLGYYRTIDEAKKAAEMGRKTYLPYAQEVI